MAKDDDKSTPEDFDVGSIDEEISDVAHIDASSEDLTVVQPGIDTGFGRNAEILSDEADLGYVA